MSMLTLWLMPDDAAFERLSQLIESLSSYHHTPRFEPHVTLLSGIEDSPGLAIQKAGQLAQAIGKPVRASLTRIEYLELYYKCLFFRTDESEELFEARGLAEELFEHTNIQPFIPHISFLYGSLPTFTKQNIIQTLGDSFFMDFYLSELHLVETALTPDKWQTLARFRLG